MQKIKCTKEIIGRRLPLTIGKKYEVVDKGKSKTFKNECYYEIVDDNKILECYDASFFENWEADDFEITKIETNDNVNHPQHYGGENNVYETIKVIEAWELNFNIGNCVKYLSRAGKKDDILQDLEKAAWYIQREIEKLKKQKQ